MGEHKTFCKVIKVINSCETKEQLQVASTFAKLYFEKSGTAQYMCAFKDIINKKRNEVN